MGAPAAEVGPRASAALRERGFCLAKELGNSVSFFSVPFVLSSSAFLSNACHLVGQGGSISLSAIMIIVIINRESSAG